MSSAFDVVPAALLLAGSALTLLAAVGLQRFDSVFARMHAATKATTLGVALVALGAMIRVESRADEITLLLAAGLQLVTTPVAAHLVARAAYRSGTELGERTRVDELAGVRVDEEA